MDAESDDCGVQQQQGGAGVAPGAPAHHHEHHHHDAHVSQSTTGSASEGSLRSVGAGPRTQASRATVHAAAPRQQQQAGAAGFVPRRDAHGNIPCFVQTSALFSNMCGYCGTRSTSGCWRRGWEVAPGAFINLCNKCGLRHKAGKLEAVPEPPPPQQRGRGAAAAAATPAGAGTAHAASYHSGAFAAWAGGAVGDRLSHLHGTPVSPHSLARATAATAAAAAAAAYYAEDEPSAAAAPRVRGSGGSSGSSSSAHGRRGGRGGSRPGPVEPLAPKGSRVGCSGASARAAHGGSGQGGQMSLLEQLLAASAALAGTAGEQQGEGVLGADTLDALAPGAAHTSGDVDRQQQAQHGGLAALLLHSMPTPGLGAAPGHHVGGRLTAASDSTTELLVDGRDSVQAVAAVLAAAAAAAAPWAGSGEHSSSAFHHSHHAALQHHHQLAALGCEAPAALAALGTHHGSAPAAASLAGGGSSMVPPAAACNGAGDARAADVQPATKKRRTPWSAAAAAADAVEEQLQGAPHGTPLRAAAAQPCDDAAATGDAADALLALHRESPIPPPPSAPQPCTTACPAPAIAAAGAAAAPRAEPRTGLAAGAMAPGHHAFMAPCHHAFMAPGLHTFAATANASSITRVPHAGADTQHLLHTAAQHAHMFVQGPHPEHAHASASAAAAFAAPAGTAGLGAPAALSAWTCEQLQAWLHSCGCGEAAVALAAAGVDGGALCGLLRVATQPGAAQLEERLRCDLGVQPAAQRMRLLDRLLADVARSGVIGPAAAAHAGSAV